MGCERDAPSAVFVKHKTRRQRRFAENLKKAAIWAFLLLFVASIVGVVVAVQVTGGRPTQ